MKLNYFKKLFLAFFAAISLGAQSLYSEYQLVLTRTTSTKAYLELYYGGKHLGGVDIDHKSPNGFLKDLAINEDMRGKGIGGKLFKFTVDFMMAFGCKKINLVASPTNLPIATGSSGREEALKRLVKFYERLGCNVSSPDNEVKRIGEVCFISRKMHYVPSRASVADPILMEYFFGFVPKVKDFAIPVRPDTTHCSLSVGSSEICAADQARERAKKLLGNFCNRYFQSLSFASVKDEKKEAETKKMAADAKYQGRLTALSVQ